MVSTHSRRFSAARVLVAASIVIATENADAQQITSWTAIQEGPAVTAVLGRAIPSSATRPRPSFELATRFDTPIDERLLVRLEAAKAAWRLSGYEYSERPTFARASSPGALVSDRMSVTHFTASLVRRHLGAPAGWTPFYAGGGIGAYRYRSEERRRTYSRPWHFGIHGLVGFEAPLPNTRMAITGELQGHMPGAPWDSVANAPWFSILNASIGLKIRM